MTAERASLESRVRSLSADKSRLLELLRAKRSAQSGALQPLPRKAGTPAFAPLSSAQQRLWFFEQLETGSPVYNIPVAWRIHGVLDVQALSRAFEAVIARHEILRTVFFAVEGEPTQKVVTTVPFALILVDLSDKGTGEQERAARRYLDADADEHFDLANAPLLRVRLIRLSASDHVLAITMHHIASDGWSIGVLIRELAELHAAYMSYRPATLPSLPIQYSDYVHWQRDFASEIDARRELAYWKKALAGAPECLDLPMDRPRPSTQSFRGASVSASLDPQVLAAVTTLARRTSATPAMVLHAAWALVLSKLSGQEDIVIGLPVANRRRPELEGLIGLFVNTLAVRVGTQSETTAANLLLRAKSVMVDAYEHQNIAFERVVEAIQPARTLSYNPIFQVMFVMQNASQNTLDCGGLVFEEQEVPARTTKCDLILAVQELSGRTALNLVYAADLFDESTAARYLKYFQNVLKQIVVTPEIRLDDVRLMGADEERIILEKFNDTHADYPKDKLAHELFEAHVEASPSSIAVACDSETLTYAELNSRANQLARYLQYRGVARGNYLPIVMSRSVEMLVAQLATFKCGAVYVPLDPTLPKERKAFIVRDCGARHVIGVGDASEYANAEVQQIDPEAGRSDIAAQSAENLVLERRPNQAAYVMYTSGSTGVPKGVIVPHHAINRLVINNSFERFDRYDCFAHYSNPSFDASTLEVWGALANGGRIAVIPQQVVLDSAEFAASLKKHGVTAMYMSVGLFNQYTELLADVFRQMRCLMVGGDALEPKAIRRVLHASPPKRLLNVYGPTEGTTYSTTLHIDTLAENVTSVPIGRPISNAQIYILDRRNKPVPVGVIGEMYIGGDGIADGYLNRPELTVERFVPDPFSTDPQARMYKTGDLARWRSDGIIEFLGRNDHQVKVRGFRVELSEIEAHLLRHPNVAEAVVLAQGDAAGEKRLVAYVSPKSISSAPDAQTLRAYLKPLLPDYMIPSAFVVLERLPLSSTGKVDRRALPAASNDAYAGMTSEAPLDDSERVLARIWQELLGVNQIGRSDNFFQMGGHSLLAIKTIFVINSTLSTKLKVADLYGAPTIAELASRVRGEVFQDRVIDIASEAALDDRITAAREPASTRDGAVLLTGATGFVGRFMLSELLRSRSAKIYCMVRANSDEEATQRIKYAMKHWDLWRYEFESRVVAMAGDLRLPELGLSSSDYRQLADDVDSMYHCATSMNHLQTYAAAKAANVGGAKALVELATIGRTKIINYASTLGVFNAAVSTNGRSVDEATTIDDEEHHDSNGYVASKWVAEKVFMNAAQRGVPCNIFRLGLVWADSHRGRYDELQRVYRIFKSCLLSGVGIRNYQRYEMPFTAVDFVSKALAHLGGKHRSGCNVFHISAPAQMTQDVFACCNDTFGMSLELLPLYDWIREISRIHQAERALPATPLVEFALSMSENSFYDLHRTHARMRISCEKTQAELDRVGIRPPRLGVESLAMVLEDMMSRDSELVEIKERRGAGTVGSWAYDGSQPSGGPAA